MAPAHITMFVSQKPSTKNRIIWQSCKFVLSVVPRTAWSAPQAQAACACATRVRACCSCCSASSAASCLRSQDVVHAVRTALPWVARRSRTAAQLRYGPRVDTRRHGYEHAPLNTVCWPDWPPHGNTVLPPDPAALLFSEGGEVVELHTVGSLTIPRTGIKRV